MLQQGERPAGPYSSAHVRATGARGSVGRGGS